MTCFCNLAGIAILPLSVIKGVVFPPHGTPSDYMLFCHLLGASSRSYPFDVLFAVAGNLVVGNPQFLLMC